MRYLDYVHVLVHRVLANHRPHEVCEECPWVWCIHCDDFGPRGDDHSCPCPFSDADCPNHQSGVLR